MQNITKDNSLKVSGFFSQLSILLWKNLILIKRKKFSTIFEVLLSIAFISMLLITRYFVERVYIPEQKNPVYNVIDYFQVIQGYITNFSFLIIILKLKIVF